MDGIIEWLYSDGGIIKIAMFMLGCAIANHIRERRKSKK